MTETQKSQISGNPIDSLYDRFGELAVEVGLGKDFLSHRLYLQEGRKYRAMLDTVPALYRKNPEAGDTALDLFVDTLVENKNYEGLFDVLQMLSYVSEDISQRIISYRNQKYNEQWATALFESEINTDPIKAFSVTEGIDNFINAQKRTKEKPLFSQDVWTKRSWIAHDKMGERLLRESQVLLEEVKEKAGSNDEEKSDIKKIVYQGLRTWLFHRTFYRRSPTETQGRLLSELILLANDLGFNIKDETKSMDYGGLYLFRLKKYLSKEASGLLDNKASK